MKTNKTFGLMITAMLILSIGMISATTVCEDEYTIVGGTVYQEGTDPMIGISGADVEVVCNGNTLTTTSGSDGAYSVSYCGSVCDYEDNVTVTAQLGTEIESQEGTISLENNLPCVTLNIGIVNVAMSVPEFGIAVGAMTILSAVGIFFFVRRK